VIPRDYITEWRAEVPWVQDFQVEQDLVISRALVEIFSHPVLRDALAFRGGTALYKLHLKPARYSEDIDLVQTRAEPAGPMMEALREVLDPWLGTPQWKQTEGRVTFVYRFNPEVAPDGIVAAFLGVHETGRPPDHACPVREEHGRQVGRPGVHRRYRPFARSGIHVGHRDGGSRRGITPHRMSAGHGVVIGLRFFCSTATRRSLESAIRWV
jgi:Nucleotidyl transferase AbiEii toxin, Type IV TA system